MNRAAVVALFVLVAVVSTATVLIVNSRDSSKAPVTDAERAASEKFFGTDKDQPPIKDGQEMRPRW